MGPVTWLGSYIHSDLDRVGGAQREEVALELGVREAGNGDWMKDSQAFLPLPLVNSAPEVHPSHHHSMVTDTKRGIICGVVNLTPQPKVALNLQTCWLSLRSVDITKLGFHTLLQGEILMTLLLILASSINKVLRI